MKIEESLVRQIKVSDIPRLDPVTIIVEDISYGKAHVTIKCFDKSWTSYWGSMGGTVKDFFSRCNVYYLVNCFDRGIRAESDQIDYGSMKQTFNEKIKQYIVEKRRWSLISKEVAKELWGNVDIINFESIVPEHEHACFNWKTEHWSINPTVWRNLFYFREYSSNGSEDFDQWLWDNIPFVYEDNPDYKYLCRIVEVVKKVLSEEER